MIVCLCPNETKAKMGKLIFSQADNDTVIQKMRYIVDVFTHTHKQETKNVSWQMFPIGAGKGIHLILYIIINRHHKVPQACCKLFQQERLLQFFLQHKHDFAVTVIGHFAFLCPSKHF